MRGPYEVSLETKPKPTAINPHNGFKNLKNPLNIDHVSGVIRNEMSLPKETEFHFVRSRPWSSIIEFSHKEKLFVAKVEHLSSDLYFCFIKALPILNTDTVISPICFVKENCISVFEIEQKLTLREELRRGGQTFDQLNDVMFGYGLLQLNFTKHRAKNPASDYLFQASRKSFEEAVLSGATSADKILNMQSGCLRNEVRSLLNSNQFRELPDTLIHTDLHDGNIFFQNDRWKIGDWSELLVGPMGADIMLFFHAVGMAHPSKPMSDLVLPAFSHYMRSVGGLLAREQWIFALESGYKLLPAIQLNSLQQSTSNIDSTHIEVTTEQKFWAEALLTAFDDKQTSQNQFLNEIQTQVDRNIGIK